MNATVETERFGVKLEETDTLTSRTTLESPHLAQF